ncbi:aldehyde dehydrogenase family protein [Verrucomicrobiaceae bacterium N1E253]|uniref:Aldehyde dehydrogenase n=1 Tax=Oceaniferula marina TaxID=2748318 RepID=A0A851GFZ7_9BACT|nr:aldehyde dehydrogenase family protein [Oceaniferula marina]NWK54087.1 aldehyde dehydrogenase family protein [Oceaniferula marina]
MNQMNESLDIEEVVNRQRRYFSGGGTRDLDTRLEALSRVEHYLQGHRQELLDCLAEDLGKPAMEAYLAEYHFLLQEIRLIRGSLKSWLRAKKVKSPLYFQPCKSRIVYEPLGVTLVVGPWNYPVQLSLSPLLASIAAGNTVVLKPSEVSSASETFLLDLVDACFDPGHVSAVAGGPDVASALLGQCFDFVFFTGSTSIGRVVARKAAEHLTPSILELGGKCPAVVDASADLETAARRILAGKMFNAGQTCFAPDFVLVHHDVRSELLEWMRRILDEVPWAEEMTRIINRHHYQRIEGYLEAYQGEVMTSFDDDPETLRLAPRILPDARWEDLVMQEEIFGPVLPVLTYEDESSLCGCLRDRSSPLALYLFSKDEAWVQRLIAETRSGGVCVNDTMKQGSSLSLPFGGVGESGYGRYRGRAGVLALSNQRAVVERPAKGPAWAELMPPYGKRFEWVKKWLR